MAGSRSIAATGVAQSRGGGGGGGRGEKVAGCLEACACARRATFNGGQIPAMLMPAGLMYLGN
jgi:hypothetical protein